MATKDKRLTRELHRDLMTIARDLVKKHKEKEDGELCFNRFTYLEDLENEFDYLLSTRKPPLGKFEVSGSDIARYVYACLCLENGDTPDGSTFCGLSILD